MKRTSTEKLVQILLNNLPPRQREVLECRYGLKNGREMTLAEIGKKYDVTRERVRQVENLAIRSLKDVFLTKELNSFLAMAVACLKQFGGARRDDLLIADVARSMSENINVKNFKNRIKFLLEMSGKASFYRTDKDFASFWYLGAEDLQRVRGFVENLIQKLKTGNDWRAELKTPQIRNYLSLSKRFATNSYGDFGLAEWSDINPRTARDWAFLVLKKASKPMHFTQLAKAINGLRKGRITNVQTVHNELIKDSRFILVGRGTYGLREFNIMPGTCREVIANVLKAKGPQTSRDLIKLVLRERDFKENTLILNLQNKKHFIRLGDGRYNLREV